MAVVGIDFGNLSMLIGQAGKGGVDVILNDSSNRQTATAVSIQGKQRFIGDSGAAMARSNITNTISNIKLLVGRKYDDPDVQREISKQPYQTVKLANGGVGIVIAYDNNSMVVPAEHVFAMLLTKARDIATKANDGLNMADVVLAVPHWFTESQRRALYHACEIVSINCLKVTNESNAIALSYGIFKSAKKLFSETEPTHIMFIDMGYTGYCVTIVDFIQENMKVLATVCDRELGGRDFDDVIIEFLAESFEKKTGINVRTNKKAILKLQAAAEKAKKTLSPAGVTEANISVECLAQDYDLNALLTKDEFEKRCAPLLARLEAPLVQALSEAKLTREQISETEIVGGSSRVNAVKKRFGEILGLDPSLVNYGLKTTMNSDEAVARGCALQCAMISSRMKVKPFNIVDKVPYGIVAHFDVGEMAAGEEGTVTAVLSTARLYSRGDDFPHKPRRLTFRNKLKDFDITVTYDDEAVSVLPAGENRFIAKYTIRIPAQVAEAASSAPTTDVRITWNLDRSGFVYIQSAQLMEEILTPPTPEEEGKQSADEVGKKRFKKTELEVTIQYPGLTRDEINAAREVEANMAFEDKMIVETADKRNELESYIYTMRSRMDESLKTFVSKEESEKFKSFMTEAEDWLYNDGYDATKAHYQRKIDELRAIGNPIEARYNESQQRPLAIESLKKQLEMCKGFAANYDDAHSHITEAERQKIRNEVQNITNWMYDAIAKQNEMPNSLPPSLTSEIINSKRNALFQVTNAIMSKPKPQPVVPPSTASEEKPSNTENQKAEKDNGVPIDQSKGGPEDDSKEEK